VSVAREPRIELRSGNFERLTFKKGDSMPLLALRREFRPFSLLVSILFPVLKPSATCSSE